jgi:hypothetical protein
MPTVGSSPTRALESGRPRRLNFWTGVARWEEPHHPGPWVRSNRHANPLAPTLQHKSGRRWDTIRRTELLRESGVRGKWLVQGVLGIPNRGATHPVTRVDLQAALQQRPHRKELRDSPTASTASGSLVRSPVTTPTRAEHSGTSSPSTTERALRCDLPPLLGVGPLPRPRTLVVRTEAAR